MTMAMRFIKPKLIKPLVIAAGMTTLAVPVTAHADDASFLSQLNQAGIQFPDPSAAISAAREVCAYIADGHSAAQTARGVKNANPELSLTHASHFVTIAREAYCNQPIVPAGSAGENRTVGDGAQP